MFGALERGGRDAAAGVVDRDAGCIGLRIGAAGDPLEKAFYAEGGERDRGARADDCGDGRRRSHEKLPIKTSQDRTLFLYPRKFFGASESGRRVYWRISVHHKRAQ